MFLNTDENEPPNQFRFNIAELADTVREKLDQESVILQFQHGGIPTETVSMEAEGDPIEAALEHV